MARTQMKFRFAAFEELRREPGVVHDLDQRARRIASSAGAGYEPSTVQGRTRARASVITTTADAIRDNARYGTLLKSLDAAR